MDVGTLASFNCPLRLVRAAGHAAVNAAARSIPLRPRASAELGGGGLQ